MLRYMSGQSSTAKQPFYEHHPEYVRPSPLSPPDLTRHFFRGEDVRASLFTAICDQKKEAAMYWTQELIDSAAPADIIFTLVFAYLINYSHTRLDYLTTLAQVAAKPTPETLHMATYNLCLMPTEQRDASFFLSAVHVTRKEQRQEQQILITPQTLQVVQQNSAKWLGGVVSATLDSYLQHLLWLTTTYTNVDPRATVATSAWRPIPQSLQSSLDMWVGRVGRRSRRLPFMVARNLYGFTARGATWETHPATAELNNAHNTFHLSSYWSTLCPHLPRQDELPQWESFLNAVFMTDDIPDEWSAEDKALSHGGGALYTSNKCPKVGKWMHLWTPQQAIAMPGWRSTVFSRLENVELNYPTTIYEWLATQIDDTLLQRAMRAMGMDDDENLMEE
jgi:hypothetical protein